MYCPPCGKAVPEGSQFCLNCGEPLAITASHLMDTNDGPIQTRIDRSKQSSDISYEKSLPKQVESNSLYATQSRPQWEYKYVLFPENETLLDVPKGKKPPYVGLGNRTPASILSEMWITLQRQVHEDITVTVNYM